MENLSPEARAVIEITRKQMQNPAATPMERRPLFDFLLDWGGRSFALLTPILALMKLTGVINVNWWGVGAPWMVLASVAVVSFVMFLPWMTKNNRVLTWALNLWHRITHPSLY